MAPAQVIADHMLEAIKDYIENYHQLTGIIITVNIYKTKGRTYTLLIFTVLHPRYTVLACSASV